MCLHACTIRHRGRATRSVDHDRHCDTHVRESGTAAQPVKSETFSDQWHMRVYSHAANACHRIASERQIPDIPSRTNVRASRVFPATGCAIFSILIYVLANARVLKLLDGTWVAHQEVRGNAVQVVAQGTGPPNSVNWLPSNWLPQVQVLGFPLQ